MGRVRVNSQYLAYDPDSLYMEGARVPDENNAHDEDQMMTDPQNFSDEESKDDPMGGQSETSNSEKRQNDDKYSHLPNIDTFLNKHGLNYNHKQAATLQQQAFQNDDEEEVAEPNMEFVKAFDSFGSFNKAAGFIEDWIRTKRHNATDFTNDLPAVIERGKTVRSIIVKSRGGTAKCELNKNGAPVAPEIRNVQQLILTKDLYETVDEYVFNFTMNLL